MWGGGGKQQRTGQKMFPLSFFAVHLLDVLLLASKTPFSTPSMYSSCYRIHLAFRLLGPVVRVCPRCIHCIHLVPDDHHRHVLKKVNKITTTENSTSTGTPAPATATTANKQKQQRHTANKQQTSTKKITERESGVTLFTMAIHNVRR